MHTAVEAGRPDCKKTNPSGAGLASTSLTGVSLDYPVSTLSADNRKISPTLPVGKLSAQSRFLFIHPKALVANPGALMPHLEGTHVCPTGKRHPADTSCTGLHWWVTPSATPGTLTRYLGEGEYELRGRLGVGAPAVRYARAIFASVPITGISHIVGQGGVQGGNQAQFAAAQQSGLPVYAVRV